MSSKKRVTVKILASYSQKELDETLITLWDAGFDKVNTPSCLISGSKNIKDAKRALGIPTSRELKSIKYWQQLFSLSSQEFEDLLVSLEIKVPAKAKVLPKGSVKKLKSVARKKNIPQISIIHPQKNAEEVEVTTEFNWVMCGKICNIRYLSYVEVEGIHWALVDDFSKGEDPIDPPGIRSSDLLHSAVFRPQTSIGDQWKYPTVEMSGAALLHSIVHDHAFYNGNKRTALVSLLVFLDENGVILNCNENELFKFVLLVAQHRIIKRHKYHQSDRESLRIANWIYENSRPIEKGERPLPFRKLRKILNTYDCEFQYGKSGSKMNISRIVTKERFLRKPIEKVLKTQIYYGGDGKEVERNTINKIRADLELDESHGFDSAVFYDNGPRAADEYIMMYRKTLNRLAKL